VVSSSSDCRTPAMPTTWTLPRTWLTGTTGE
jgi:hypothetical protein